MRLPTGRFRVPYRPRLRRPAGTRLDLGTIESAPEDNVDGAADGVPAVQSGGAVARDLDTLDGRHRQGIEIDSRIADAAPVHEDRSPAAPEDEGTVETEAVVVGAAHQEIPDVYRTGELDVLAVDRGDRVRVVVVAGDVAGGGRNGIRRHAAWSKHQCARWEHQSREGPA